MRRVKVAFLVCAIVFAAAFAEVATAGNKVYSGEIAVPKKLRTEGVPEKFSYAFDEIKEGRGALKISTKDYYYWVHISDWGKRIFGQTAVRSNDHARWYKIEWQNGKPAGETDRIIVARIQFFMDLIKQ